MARVVSVTRTLDAPIDKIWPLLADVTKVERFHPWIRTSPALSPQTVGMGAKRRSDFYDGSSLVETVVAWEEYQRIVLEFSQFTFNCRQASIEYSVSQSGEQTNVSIKLEYVPKFGALGRTLASVTTDRRFKKMLHATLAGLETHLKTGQRVGKDGLTKKAS